MINLLFRLILLFTSYQLLVTGSFALQDEKIYKESRMIMGTIVEVSSPDEQALDIAFAAIEKIDGLLSKYDPDSEISKLNSQGIIFASPETFFVLKKSIEFYEITKGYFDITVAPLIDLWGFTDKEYTVPDREEILETLTLIGSDKIILNEIDNMVKFNAADMKIDLGGIAKGYAVDFAVQQLRLNGIESCLINAGGDIYCLGNKFGKPWRIAIKNPRGLDSLDYLELEDKAVATSGDYEQYFTKDNKNFSHILNPKTGYPADTGVISVTVIADDCLTADALATSLMVLDKPKGKRLMEKFSDLEFRIFENPQ